MASVFFGEIKEYFLSMSNKRERKEIEYCSVCPVSSSLSGYPLKKIPSFICEIQKIKINEILRFLKEL